ncbi:hypothetical protein N7541_000578 [Penicillium brevicompactum]|nr:hypothetical protein N7541_000578 [Penicillium brevicompactum]
MSSLDWSAADATMEYGGIGMQEESGRERKSTSKYRSRIPKPTESSANQIHNNSNPMLLIPLGWLEAWDLSAAPVHYQPDRSPASSDEC